MNTIVPFPTTRLLLTESQLCAWVGQAAPGDVVEYHRGFLAIDAMRASSNLNDADRRELVRLRRRSFWAFENNLAFLMQRRLGPDHFSYLAIARMRPKRLQATLLTLLAQDPERARLPILTFPSAGPASERSS